jgi:hypothetical protein
MRGTLAWTQIVTLFPFENFLERSDAFWIYLFKHLLALYLLSGSTPVRLSPLLWTDLIPIWLGGF